MSNALIPADIQLPAHLLNRNLASNASALGGIKAGGFARISIKGSRFTLVDGEERNIIVDAGGQLPIQQLQVVIVGYNKYVNKTWYPGPYKEGDDSEPACSSDDGITPDPYFEKPQSQSCATCPHNEWGSKISIDGSGTKGKACADNKRLVIVRAEDLSDQAMGLSVTPSALRDFSGFVKKLDAKGVDIKTIVTTIQFDHTASHAKLVFGFGRFLTPEELAKADMRAESEEVKTIAMPRRVGAPVQQAAKPVEQALVQTIAPAPQPIQQAVSLDQLVNSVQQAPVAVSEVAEIKQVEAVIDFDPFIGEQPFVKQAVDFAGGINTPAGAAMYKNMTGKDVPNTAVIEVKPVDPFEGQPDFVKQAIDRVGGLGTPAGDAMYKQFTGKDAAPRISTTGTEPEKVKRTRKPKETPVQPAVVNMTDLVQTRQSAIEVPSDVASLLQFQSPQTKTVATTPAANESIAIGPTSGGSFGADLDALLASAMSVSK